MNGIVSTPYSYVEALHPQHKVRAAFEARAFKEGLS